MQTLLLADHILRNRYTARQDARLQADDADSTRAEVIRPSLLRWTAPVAPTVSTNEGLGVQQGANSTLVPHFNTLARWPAPPDLPSLPTQGVPYDMQNADTG